MSKILEKQAFLDELSWVRDLSVTERGVKAYYTVIETYEEMRKKLELLATALPYYAHRCTCGLTQILTTLTEREGPMRYTFSNIVFEEETYRIIKKNEWFLCRECGDAPHPELWWDGEESSEPEMALIPVSVVKTAEQQPSSDS